MSCTTASRRPMIRLTSVDFPTLGRPTTARIGTTAGASVWSGSVVMVHPSCDVAGVAQVFGGDSRDRPRERAAGAGHRFNEMLDESVPRIGRGASYLCLGAGPGVLPPSIRRAVHEVES